MKQIIKNVRDCYNHIPYTWKHWIAFMKTEKKLLGYHSHWFHDWDKLILFIILSPRNGKNYKSISSEDK